MPLSYVAFVRAYERAVSAVRRDPSDFPPQLDRWFDSRFRDREIRSGRVRYYPLNPLSATLAATQAPIVLSRAVVDSPHLRLCDAIVWTQPGPDGLPDGLHGRSWELLIGEEFFRVAGEDRALTLSEIWDGAVEEVVGVDPQRWRKTGFGSLNLFVEGRQRASEIVAACASEGSQTVTAAPGHQVVVERNRCTVILPPGTADEPMRGGYLMLTALLGRSRHFAWTLLDDVTSLAERCSGVAGTAASAVLGEAAELQRRAVLVRREIRAADYLADPWLISLFHRSAPVALADHDRRALDDALEALDRLVNGVFAVASDRAQQRLNHVGFAVALAGLLLAATGLTDLLAAPEHDRTWVYAAWVLLLVLLLGVVGASRMRLRARPRNSQRGETR